VGRLGLAESEEIMHRLLATARESIAPLRDHDDETRALLHGVCDYVGVRRR
jgi:hypothetical protein